MSATDAGPAAGGPVLLKDGWRFRVWAPNASRVSVTGSFNDWRDDEFRLEQHEGGTWEGTVASVRAGDEYLFVIDNRGGDENNPGQPGLRRIDPFARATRGSSGNGVIVDVDAELAESGLLDDSFVTPAPTEWLLYEVHVGSFSGGGDGIDTGSTGTGTFAQFVEKLPYIRSLGFNAIALLPVHQNPGDGNEGYGPSHLFAPESSFGSPMDLRRLVRAAHDVGLAVVFDVVWNHLSDFDNSLWEFDGMTRDGGIYFEGGERSPWGPRLAFWKREVRDLVIANARCWLEEYHADGLRIDAANEIGRDVLADVIEAIRNDPDLRSRLLVAEWTGDDASGWDALVDELGFDKVWSLGDPYQFRGAMDEQAGDAWHRLEQLASIVDLPGAASRIRYVLGSHDDAHDNQSGRLTSHRYFIELAGGRDDLRARAKARLGWALCAAIPGTPLLFMGAECHQAGYWHPRTDDNPLHGDHRFDWTQCGDTIGREMRALVTTVNQARWDYPSLRGPELYLVHLNQQDGVLAFIRPATTSSPVLVIVNVSDHGWADGSYRVPVPGDDGEWRAVLDTQAAQFGGVGFLHHPATTIEGVLSVTLPPMSLVMLARVP